MKKSSRFVYRCGYALATIIYLLTVSLVDTADAGERYASKETKEVVQKMIAYDEVVIFDSEA